jgi:hypothetical protein
MNTVVITFATNGAAHCLYSELIDLRRLGALQIKRASRLEFKPRKQRWEVREHGAHRLLFSNPSRAICVAWEQKFFNH